MDHSSTSNDTDQARDGFTLPELLLVLVVVAVLAAVLLPARSAARIKAQSIACLSNKRQLGLGWVMYTHDQNGKLASSLINRKVAFFYLE